VQLHLDPIGGIAGDMFIAALLDAFPEHEEGVLASIRVLGIEPKIACRAIEHHDGVLRGCRFEVKKAAAGSNETAAHPDYRLNDQHHAHALPARNAADYGIATTGHATRHAHGVPSQHTSWRTLRKQLQASPLAAPVKRHAIGIFAQLAGAEGRVHGIAADEVQFHEVGAWDSIADIVGAAYLIAELDSKRWTLGPLPLGAGRARTAHGLMPVPAPATAHLLQGFVTVDDGVPGERVTPTGAAIIRYLHCAESARAEPRVLQRSGTGFGSRILPGLSNCLRVLVFEEAVPASAGRKPSHRELAVIEFEVDDQAAEDTAMGLDRLRAHPAIFDVVQAPVFGKKGRMMTHVRALVCPEALDEAIAACFRETTTIGLRHRIIQGSALPRRLEEVEVEGRRIRVKVVERPDGPTAKAEADDVLAGESHVQRAELRAEAERRALALAERERANNAHTQSQSRTTELSHEHSM
jgi:uncharacterized protein (TIGR00299 family) protein